MTTENVSDNARVSGNAWVSGDAQVSGNAWVSGNALVFGDAWVFGDARVFGDAEIFEREHVLVVDLGRYPVTMYRTSGGGHALSIGCQTLTLDSDFVYLAAENGYWVPPSHRKLVDWLRDVAASWGDEG